MGRVMVVKTDEQTVHQAVEDIFQTFEPDVAGKRVLIKPNLVSAASPDRAITTHPSVVKAVLDACLKRGADPTVGDNCMKGESIMDVTGIAEVCGEACRSIGVPSEMKTIVADKPYEVPISKAVLDADYIINVPKMKTHVLAGITVCVKNMFGVIPGNRKAKMHALTGHAKPFTHFLVELYRYRPPDFNIVDAIIAMEGNGPSNGTPRRLNRLIGGPNGVEVDAVCAHLMGFGETRLVKTLDFASQSGLGEIDISKIDLVGDLDVVEDFQKPSTYTVHLKGKEKKKSSYAARAEEVFGFWDFLGSLNPQCDEDNCTLCGECEAVCPQNAIKIDPYPEVDKEKCISCFCCMEACLYDAMKVPNWEEIQKKRRSVLDA